MENRWTNRWIEGQLTQAYPVRMAIWGSYNESVAILCLPVQRFAQDQKPWPGEKRRRHGGSFSLNHHQTTTHSHHSIQSICSFRETFPLTLLPAEPEAFRVPKSNRSHVVINPHKNKMTWRRQKFLHQSLHSDIVNVNISTNDWITIETGFNWPKITTLSV